MRCNNCESEITKSSKFCAQCGNKVETKKVCCSNCGKEILDGASFCMMHLIQKMMVKLTFT